MTYTTAHDNTVVLNPLSEARNGTHVLMDASWVVATEPQQKLLFFFPLLVKPKAKILIHYLISLVDIFEVIKYTPGINSLSSEVA